MNNTIHGIFAEIYNNKKDRRLKSWLSKAEFRLRQKGVDELARYLTADDVILEIITRVLTGKIRWDRERVPNINTFMFHQIRSYIANLLKKELRNQTLYRSCYESLPCPARKKTPVIQADKKDEPELRGVSMEEILDNQYFLDVRGKVLDLLEDDDLAYIVFNEQTKGYENRDIAKRFNIPPEKVKLASRRARKIYRKAFDE